MHRLPSDESSAWACCPLRQRSLSSLSLIFASYTPSGGQYSGVAFGAEGYGPSRQRRDDHTPAEVHFLSKLPVPSRRPFNGHPYVAVVRVKTRSRPRSFIQIVQNLNHPLNDTSSLAGMNPRLHAIVAVLPKYRMRLTVSKKMRREPRRQARSSMRALRREA